MDVRHNFGGLKHLGKAGRIERVDQVVPAGLLDEQLIPIF